jgi:hypothetical protein
MLRDILQIYIMEPGIGLVFAMLNHGVLAPLLDFEMQCAVNCNAQ